MCTTFYTYIVADQTHHFYDVLVRKNVAYGYDVGNLTVKVILLRVSSGRKWIF